MGDQSGNNEVSGFDLEANPITIATRLTGYRRGMETRERILRAAHDLLVDEGYHALSMRRIAREAQVELGNLTYHYASKDELVSALLNAIIAEPGLAPRDAMIRLCGFILDDITTWRTTRIFPELWAISNHDPQAAERVDDMYERARAAIARAISRIDPAMDAERLRLVSLFVSAAMEGIGIFAGYGKRHAPDMAEIKIMAMDAFLHLCEMPEQLRPKPA